MEDLSRVKCDFLTIGQYLRPTSQNVEIIEYIHPDIFTQYKEEGEKMGFRYVSSSLAVYGIHIEIKVSFAILQNSDQFKIFNFLNN